MRFTQILGLLVQASILQGALSAPVTDVHERGLVKRYTGDPSPKKGDGPDTSDYPTDDEIRAAYIAPSGPSVFFSMIPSDYGGPNQGGSNVAYKFAQSIGGVIFRGTFPKKYTNMNGRSAAWYQNFADRFSGVFAEKASGTAYIVGPWEGEIDACRVWQRIKYPTLQDNLEISRVTLVDYTNFENQKIILGTRKRHSALISRFTASTRAPAALFDKRQEASCFDWEGDGEDPICCVGESA